jgi:large subunit ribosomal protein L28
VTLASESLGRSFRLRIAAKALRSVDHVGGLDQFLLKARDEQLSGAALKIKRELKKAAAAA